MAEKITTLEDLMLNTIGRCGCYQIVVITFIFLHRAPVGLHLLSVAVMSPGTAFNCSDPQYDKCDKDCPEHTFDKTYFESSIVTKWDLVCDRKIITSVIQGMVMLGILIGSVIFGWAGDQFGRLYPLCVAVTLQLIAGVASSFAPEIYSYTILRFLTTLATGGSMIPSFALFLEFTDKKYRTSLGIFYMIPVHIAHAALGVVAYFCRRWDCIQLAVSLYSICLLPYWFILPESPRWLLTRNKTERIIKILEKAAKWNKMPTEDIRSKTEQLLANMKPVSKPGTIKDLFVTSRMRTKTLILMANWFVISMEFYAIAQYLGLIPGDLFVRIVIAGIVQIPGNLIGCALIFILGRKWTIIVSYFILSLPMCAVIVLMIKWSHQHMVIGILCCIAQTGSAMCFALIYLYTGELFPTTVRSAGIGICSMFARVGSIIAPFIMELDAVAKWFPPLIFATIPILPALATMIWLPETINKPLPDTVEEADQF